MQNNWHEYLDSYATCSSVRKLSVNNRSDFLAMKGLLLYSSFEYYLDFFAGFLTHWLVDYTHQDIFSMNRRSWGLQFNNVGGFI